MLITLLISLSIIGVFITSILFFPTMEFKGRRIKIYSFIPLIGAIILILCDRIKFSRIVSAFLENTSVNPLKILILFLSMTVFSLILEQTGFFSYISSAVLKKAGHNQFLIFLSFYSVISLLTIFTSNDIIILTFTPFICHFCKSAKVDPLPYLIMEFVAANTWSLLLIIGNPTNIYLCSAFEIGFIPYLKTMFLPTIFAGLSSLFVMFIIFGKKLRQPMQECEEHGEITDKPIMVISLIHLLICVVALAISQYISLEMWIISLTVALSEIICVAICLLVRKKNFTPLSRGLMGMPFEIIPFIVGMFIIVLALDDSGITSIIQNALAAYPDRFTYGYLSFFSANIVNNIPMSVLFSKILTSAESVSIGGVFATVIGSNIGAFLTPIGALAGIMWSNLLRKNGVKITFARFIKYGTVIGLVAVSASLGGLYLIL